jgi:hypothetical protein
MKHREEASVDDFFERLSPEQTAIVLRLREVVLLTVPGVEESVAWGALSYHRPWLGGRVKGAVCQIVVKAGKVRLDFIHGAALSDPDGLLRGDRLSKRFVPIAGCDEARRPEIEDLIRAAASLIPGPSDSPRA